MRRGVLVSVDSELVAAAADLAAKTGEEPAKVFERWVRVGVEYERSVGVADRADNLHAPGGDRT